MEYVNKVAFEDQQQYTYIHACSGQPQLPGDGWSSWQIPVFIINQVLASSCVDVHLYRYFI